jgi:hypothetical protein
MIRADRVANTTDAAHMIAVKTDGNTGAIIRRAAAKFNPSLAEMCLTRQRALASLSFLFSVKTSEAELRQ